jgi:hypothetical protein
MKKVILVFMLLFCIQNCGPVFAQRFQVAVTDTTTLTAPGYSNAVWCGSGFTKMMWYFKINSINTSVALAIQIKKGNSQWTNAQADSLVYTANGNYGIEFDSIALADSTRLRFIYEIGGTSALITHNVALMGGN